ncbi:MAG: hypothetical protein WCO00_16365 [Rhodospirillaceae bacterium]
MSAPDAFAIESHGRSAGIVAAERGGFMVCAAERAARRVPAAHDTRHRH